MKQWNQDKFIIYFDSERFSCRFVDENQRPSTDVCMMWNSPILDTNLAQTPISVQLWGSKLSKSCQDLFLPSLWGKKRTLTNEHPVSLHAFVWGRYLCLEPGFPVAVRFHASCSAVTSALASPIALIIHSLACQTIQQAGVHVWRDLRAQQIPADVQTFVCYTL